MLFRLFVVSLAAQCLVRDSLVPLCSLSPPLRRMESTHTKPFDSSHTHSREETDKTDTPPPFRLVACAADPADGVACCCESSWIPTPLLALHCHCTGVESSRVIMSKRDGEPATEEPNAKKQKQDECVDIVIDAVSPASSSASVVSPSIAATAPLPAAAVDDHATTRLAKKIMPDTFDVHEAFYPRQTDTLWRTCSMRCVRPILARVNGHVSCTRSLSTTHSALTSCIMTCIVCSLFRCHQL